MFSYYAVRSDELMIDIVMLPVVLLGFAIVLASASLLIAAEKLGLAGRSKVQQAPRLD